MPTSTNTIDQVLNSLEAGNAEPTPEQYLQLESLGIEFRDFAKYYAVATRELEAFEAMLVGRLGDFTPPEEIRMMAARSFLAQALVSAAAHRLDAQNARAQLARAEQAGQS